jgi:hypothetical protein
MVRGNVKSKGTKKAAPQVSIADRIDLQNRAEQAAKMATDITYQAFYGLAYGVVYAGLFATQMLKGDNPMCNGMRDGATAASAAVKEPRQVVGARKHPAHSAAKA